MNYESSRLNQLNPEIDYENWQETLLQLCSQHEPRAVPPRLQVTAPKLGQIDAAKLDPATPCLPGCVGYRKASLQCCAVHDCTRRILSPSPARRRLCGPLELCQDACMKAVFVASSCISWVAAEVEAQVAEAFEALIRICTAPVETHCSSGARFRRSAGSLCRSGSTASRSECH